MSQPFAPQLIYRTPDGDPTEHATAPTDDSPAAQWLLPDLAVAGLPGDNARLTVVLADVIAQPGSPRPAQMPGWLRQYYLPGPTAQRTVTGPGPVTIVQGVRMPRGVLAEARGPVVLELHWNVSWWGLRSGAGHAVLRQPLTFGTDHTTASRHVWRPPVGGIGTRSVAGIDIGTGSTAVTLYAEREVSGPRRPGVGSAPARPRQPRPGDAAHAGGRSGVRARPRVPRPGREGVRGAVRHDRPRARGNLPR